MGAAAQKAAGHRLAGGEQLHCASLVLYTLVLLSSSSLIFFPFSVLLNCLHLNLQIWSPRPGTLPYPTAG